MAREYPRFLFSNPKNTKSEGPFLVHLLEPRIVFKVNTKGPAASPLEELNRFANFSLTALDPVDYNDRKIADVHSKAEQWLFSQIKSGDIRF